MTALLSYGEDDDGVFSVVIFGQIAYFIPEEKDREKFFEILHEERAKNCGNVDENMAYNMLKKLREMPDNFLREKCK